MAETKPSLNTLKDYESNKVRRTINKNKNLWHTMGKVFYYAKPYKFYFILTIIFDLINSAAEIMIPIFMGKAINCAIGAGVVNFSQMTTYIIFMAISVIIAAIFGWLANITITAFNYKTTYRIRSLLFEKISKLPISFIDSPCFGKSISSLNSGVTFII